MAGIWETTEAERMVLLERVQRPLASISITANDMNKSSAPY